MKTIVVKTEKVVAHKGNGMPEIETIEQKINPELTFLKFLKYLPNQNYKSVTVIRVLDSVEKEGKVVSKEVDEVKKYQSMVDEKLSSPQTKPGDAVDYKALSEKQSAQMTELMQRLEALESKGKGKEKTQERLALESEANDLGISFRDNIGDDKLKEKIEKAKL